MLLLLAALIGAAVSLAGWGFLVSVHEIQSGLFDDLPDALGLDPVPSWWALPMLLAGGVLAALAITRLPGNGGHVAAEGLSTGTPHPLDLPGVILAALASLSFGAVLGPEAPLVALGAGLAVLLVAPMPRPIPPEAMAIVAAAGSFAAISLIFGNPIIAAVLLLEIAGLGRDRIPLMLLPGLVAAAVGSLIYIGLGSWSGLSTSAYSIPPIHLPEFNRPTAVDFLWTLPRAAVVAIGVLVIITAARRLYPLVARRALILIPLAGLAVAGLAIAFDAMTDRGIDQVLFSGQSSLPGLAADAAGWSAAALAALLLCKGVAWSISLASFRGGPIFPSLLLGAAAGILAADLPGFDLTPAVAVGMGAAMAAAIRLPLGAALLAVILTASSGPGATPLIIVGVAVGFVVSALAERLVSREEPVDAAAAPAPRPAGP